MAGYIGIDLGTTNSCVAVWRNGLVEVIANNFGSRTTPSWVAFTEEERIVGKTAILQYVRNPQNTVHDVKRLMGRDFDDPLVQEDIKRWLFKVVNVDGKPRIEVNFKKKVKHFAPEEIGAMVLGNIKATAEAFIGGEVKGAVIAVPAYFNDAQRRATLNAGEIAGLNVLELINEPTAAALAYGLNTEQKGKKNILIYDLGGGTFDVSIVCIEPGPKFTVLATTGDTHLGGGDFDKLIVEHLSEEYLKSTGISVSNNKKSLCKLKLPAEEAKIILSSEVYCQVDIDSLANGEDLGVKISRAVFENQCFDLIHSTLDHVRKALDDAKLTKSDIYEVVLVGGSTRIPMVQNLLQEFFPGTSLKMTVNADEAVAYGAAVQAAILSGDTDINFKNIVNDITSLSLGTDLASGLMAFVVPRNTRIPCNISRSFSTCKDNQKTMSVYVLEGERTMWRDNHVLGHFALSGIPPAPSGEGSALVTFDLNASGILKVTAVEKVTGKSESIVIQMREKGLSAQEVARMKRDAETYREEDRLQRQMVEAKNQLERLRLQRK